MSLLIAALKRSDANKNASISSTNARLDSLPSPTRDKVAYVFSAVPNKNRWVIITSISLILSGIWLAGSYNTQHEATNAPLAAHPLPAPPTAPESIAITLPALQRPSATVPTPRSIPRPDHLPLLDKRPSPVTAASKSTKKQHPPQISQTHLSDLQNPKETDAVDRLLTAAYTAYQNGDYDNASRDYHAAITLAPQNRDALLGLAVISQQQGKDAASVNYYRQVLILDPRDPLAHAGLASFGGSDRVSRENRLKQLIQLQPDEAALHLALGHLYAEQSRWPDAQQAYFNALTIEPGNALFAFNLAVSLDHLGQYRIAAQYYQQALESTPSANLGFDRPQAERRLLQLNATVD